MMKTVQHGGHPHSVFHYWAGPDERKQDANVRICTRYAPNFSVFLLLYYHEITEMQLNFGEIFRWKATFAASFKE